MSRDRLLTCSLTSSSQCICEMLDQGPASNRGVIPCWRYLNLVERPEVDLQTFFHFLQR